MAEEPIINQELKVDQREPWEKNPNFNLKLVILISFGFFSTSVWSFYDSQVSLALKDLFGNLFLVGFIMTADNIIGVFVQPWTGSLSDRTKSRFGRRMPFVLIGLPISAFFFLCLGLTKDNPVLYIIVVLGFITSMAFWRAPIVALMPDFVHPKDRSKGNAIVNALAGIGTAAITLVGGIILDINYALAFALLAGVMIVALIILFVGVKEPDTRNWDFIPKESKMKEKKPSFADNIRFIMQEEDKSMIWMMLAIFSWFIAYNTGSSFISIYATELFDFSKGQAAFLVTATAVSFLVFAAVSVKLANTISRRKTIMVGLGVWCVGYLIGSILVGPENAFVLYITTILMGFGWACININSIVMVWQMAPDEKSTGVYTGLYYAASFTSQIVGPLTFGFIFEYGTGIRYMLLLLSILIIVAFLFMTRVTRGEVALSDEEKERRKKLAENQDD
jgi:Na+/melibiose symporter-like transporter